MQQRGDSATNERPSRAGQYLACDSSTRAREVRLFHGAFYGRRIFCCKTTQFGETPRK